MKKISGFTQVELLAVLVVVAILAALLFPVLAKAKRKGAGAVCLNNVRQMNLGLANFVQEHHDYPLDGGMSGGFFTWQRAVALKLFGDGKGEEFWPQNKGIFDCPAEGTQAYDEKRGPFYDYGYNSFGVGDKNKSLGLSGEDSKSSTPVNESAIVDPAGMMSLGDGFWGGGGVVGDGTPRLSRMRSASVDGAQSARASKRHIRKATVGFVDGHAELISLQELFANESDTALARWNRDNQPNREIAK